MEWTNKAMQERYDALTSTRAASAEPFCDTTINARRFVVYLTPRFVKATKKHRSKGPALWSTLQNLRYGYDPLHANSPGGKDGIFNVTPNYKPKNAMIKKLYDHYLHTTRGQEELSRYVKDLTIVHGIRVVSHHARLLGFIDHQPTRDLIILTDIDQH